MMHRTPRIKRSFLNLVSQYCYLKNIHIQDVFLLQLQTFTHLISVVDRMEHPIHANAFPLRKCRARDCFLIVHHFPPLAFLQVRNPMNKLKILWPFTSLPTHSRKKSLASVVRGVSRLYQLSFSKGALAFGARARLDGRTVYFMVLL